MNKLLKIFQVIKRFGIKNLSYLNVDLYMRLYTAFLIKNGLIIEGSPKFISNSAYFDGNDYSKICLGDNITISREVMFLTHDYSITTALASIGKDIRRHEGELFFSEKIKIGKNCFIGARASILPNTTIGNNVIIGAGSVVKGTIPDNSIVIGNPSRIIGRTDEFARKHLELKDFYVE